MRGVATFGAREMDGTVRLKEFTASVKRALAAPILTLRDKGLESGTC